MQLDHHTVAASRFTHRTTDLLPAINSRKAFTFLRLLAWTECRGLAGCLCDLIENEGRPEPWGLFGFSPKTTDVQPQNQS
jgi:hypothetical protein